MGQSKTSVVILEIFAVLKARDSAVNKSLKLLFNLFIASNLIAIVSSDLFRAYIDKFRRKSFIAFFETILLPPK